MGPLPARLRPVRGELVQGSLKRSNAMSFADGSGYNQSSPTAAIAAWAVIRGPSADASAAREVMRGRLDGWFRTVPRAEIRAAVAAVEAAAEGATTVHDCELVVKGLEHGVPPAWCSSGNFHADLWRRARSALARCGQLTVNKTKAHRTRAQAEADVGDPLGWWLGNSVADLHAKAVAKEQDDVECLARIEACAKQETYEHLVKLGIAAAWVVKQLPEADGSTVKMGGRAWARGARVSDHDMADDPKGGWRCRKCRLFARTKGARAALLRKPCRGDLAAQAHPSHVLDWTGGVLWCRLCAAYAARLPRQLKAQCSGAPRSEAQRNVRRRLRWGLPPTTAQYVADIAKERPLPREQGDPADARPAQWHLLRPDGALSPPCS